MKIYKRAVLPLGFKANGIACGIKKSGKLDLALFYSEVPAKAGCVFTTNKILAAPVIVCKNRLKNNQQFRAIIANSGNANCFTGRQGIRDAEAMTACAALALGIDKRSILVASTGIIGRKLPFDKIKSSISNLARGLTNRAIEQAKRAIMTTDTFSKEVTVKYNLGAKPVTICGIVKGSGMIAPNMGTLLCFIFTDANITQDALNKALKIAVANSFNCITVDGCMSTNDSLMVLANAMSTNAAIDLNNNFLSFSKALNTVCLRLAKMVVQDAEGATKFIQIKVKQARNPEEAKAVALSIANSNLFKTAMFASSANIVGRIVASVGASGVGVKEEGLKVGYSPLKRKEVIITVSLKRGNAQAGIYTSDLSYEYVKINAEYN